MAESFNAQVCELMARLGPPFDSPEGSSHLALLLAAHTEEEHRRASAGVVVFLLGLLRQYGPPEIRNVRGAPGLELASLIASPPAPGSGRKPPRDQLAVSDARWLLAVNADFDTHAKAIAHVEKITVAAARRRIERAEKLAGFRLPRLKVHARSFRKKDK